MEIARYSMCLMMQLRKIQYAMCHSFARSLFRRKLPISHLTDNFHCESERSFVHNCNPPRGVRPLPGIKVCASNVTTQINDFYKSLHTLFWKKFSRSATVGRLARSFKLVYCFQLSPRSISKLMLHNTYTVRILMVPVWYTRGGRQ
jgi:hypothetical protein